MKEIKSLNLFFASLLFVICMMLAYACTGCFPYTPRPKDTTYDMSGPNWKCHSIVSQTDSYTICHSFKKGDKE